MGEVDNETAASAAVRWQPHVLTVLGIAVAVLGAAYLGLSGEGETLEWRLYMALGTVFPAILLGVSLLAPRLDQGEVRLFDAVFGVLGGVAGSVYVAGMWSASALFISVTCILIGRAYGEDALGEREVGSGRRWVDQAVTYLTLLIAAHVFVGVGWWRNPVADQPQLSLSGVLLVVALVAGVSALVVREPRGEASPRRTALLAMAVVPLFALAALRLPREFHPDGAYYHWGVFVGPADLVRQGGLLLWDVPATYGTLLTLSIAWFPTTSTWEALRYVAATCVFGSAMILFGLVFAARRSVGGFLLGAGLAATTVFLLPNHTYDFVGPFPFPSTGGFRFGPAYVALVAAAVEAMVATRETPSVAARRGSLAFGSVVWVAAVLWSFESAIYATAIWIPAIGWSRFHIARRLRPAIETQVAIAHGAAGAALPFGLLLLFVGGVAVWNRSIQGADLDLSGYGEYAASFARKGFFSMPIDPWAYGPAQIVLLLSFLCTALARSLATPNALGRQVAGLAAFGAVWSTASYFVARSHTNNAMILNPVEVTAFAVLWFAWTLPGARLPAMIRWIVVIWMTTLLFEAMYAPVRLRPVVTAMWTDPGEAVASRLPPQSQSLVDLLSEAGVGPEDRLVYLNRDVPLPFGARVGQGADGTDLASRPWLPIIPVAGVEPLAHERRDEYIARFAARHPGAGWYVVPKAQVNVGDTLWLKEAVEADTRPTRVFQNPEWRVEWRVPRQLPRPPTRPTVPLERLLPAAAPIEATPVEPSPPVDPSTAP